MSLETAVRIPPPWCMEKVIRQPASPNPHTASSILCTWKKALIMDNWTENIGLLEMFYNFVGPEQEVWKGLQILSHNYTSIYYTIVLQFLWTILSVMKTLVELYMVQGPGWLECDTCVLTRTWVSIWLQVNYSKTVTEHMTVTNISTKR